MDISRPVTPRKLIIFLFWAGLAAFLLSGCASKSPPYSKNGKGNWSDPTQAPYVIKGVTYYPIPDATGFREKGIASWYGKYFHGRSTSNGERYNMYDMTAAHKILPMNTMLRVRNLDNGRETVVRINDRGPFVDGRIIDLSYTAAKQLGVVDPGTSRVEIVAIADGNTALATKSSSDLPPATTVHPPVYTNIQVIKPSRQPIKAPETEFYVQVGKFREKGNALKLQKRFAEAGHTAIIEIDSDSKQPNYQVNVFAGKELTVAKRAEADLLERGYTGAALVVR